MEPDPRDELRELTRALGAHVELLQGSGAVGLPRASERADAVAPSTERAPAAPTPTSVSPGSAPESSRAAARDSKRSLAIVADEVQACVRCRLHEARTNTVFARGDGSSGVCFIGEGPGADEDAQGEPFVGKAGQLLDKMIAAMGLSRDEVYVCNIVKCRPPENRKPDPDEMAACVPYLHEQIELIQPKVLVLLGATALEGLLGVRGGITRLRGTWRLYQGRLPVMPTFHPAYLLRNARAKRDVWNDLQEVMNQVGRPVPSSR